MLRLLLALVWLTAATLAQAQSCVPRYQFIHADGTRGCLTALPLAEDRLPGWSSSVRQLVPGSGFYTLASSPRSAACPRALGMATSEAAAPSSTQSTVMRSQAALAECRRTLAAAATPATADCDCRLLIADGLSPLTADEMRAHLAPDAAATQVAAAPVAMAPPQAPPRAPPAATEPPAPAASRAPVVAEAPPGPATPAVTAAELDAVRQQLAQLQAQLAAQRAERTPAAASGPRQRARALVIGNGRYTHLGVLPNPTRDAEAMAAKLRGYGIEVDLVLDADRDRLVQALAAYQQRAAGSDVNILFYAGHGLQVGGANYIVPVDMRGEGISAAGVRLSSVSLEDMLEYLPARTRLVFLDACRDNPVARSLVATRSVAGIGLAPVQGTTGTLISYATKDGAVAEDGRGRHSPYTTALLEHLDLPLDIAVVLRRVREAVMSATGNRQQPWEYGSLVGDELVLSRLAR